MRDAEEGDDGDEEGGRSAVKREEGDEEGKGEDVDEEGEDDEEGDAVDVSCDSVTVVDGGKCIASGADSSSG